MAITKKEIAKGYDDLLEHMGLDATFYARCVAAAPAISGDVLDIGCGAGHLLRLLRERYAGARYTGIDISPKLCEASKQKNPDATIVLGDAEALPFEENSFDFIFMTEALEHMLDYDKAVSELARVLKRGGMCIVTVPNRDWASYEFYDKIRNKKFQPVDDHYFRFAEIRDLLSRHSLRITRVRGSDNLFYYGRLHTVERCVAFFLPFLHKRMKRLILLCENQK